MDFYPSIEIKFKLNSKLKLRDSLWILNYFLKEAEGAQDGDIDSLCDSKRMCKKKKPLFSPTFCRKNHPSPLALTLVTTQLKFLYNHGI